MTPQLSALPVFAHLAPAHGHGVDPGGEGLDGDGAVAAELLAPVEADEDDGERRGVEAPAQRRAGLGVDDDRVAPLGERGLRGLEAGELLGEARSSADGAKTRIGRASQRSASRSAAAAGSASVSARAAARTTRMDGLLSRRR